MQYEEIEEITTERADELGIDSGSKAVKELAANQKITISLPDEVIEEIKQQLENWDTSKPAELVFVSGEQTRAKWRVAAYAYRRRTCCA